MPRDFLERALTRAASSAQAAIDTRHSSKKATARAAERLYGSSLPANGTLFGDTNRMELAREQFEHFHGHAFSAVRVISQRIAGQPVVAARRLVEPSKSFKTLEYALSKGFVHEKDLPHQWKMFDPARMELIEDHQIVRAIDDPNPMMTRSQLFNFTIPNLLVTGRAFWCMSMEEGVLKIYPFPSTWVWPKIAGGKQTAWFVKPPSSDQKPMEVPMEQMAYFSHIDPNDPTETTSWLQMQAKPLLVGESIQDAQYEAFRNGMFPHIAIVAGQETNPDGSTSPIELEPHQRQQYIDWLRREYIGARKFNLPVILDALFTDIKEISTKPDEIPFLDSLNIVKSQIFEGFGVNPIVAGQVDGANRASSALADYHLCLVTVNPIMAMMSQVMTRQMAPFFNDGPETKIWMIPAKPYDPEMELRQWQVALRNHGATTNEFRQRVLNLPPLREDLGDIMWVRDFEVPIRVAMKGDSEVPELDEQLGSQDGDLQDDNQDNGGGLF